MLQIYLMTSNLSQYFNNTALSTHILNNTLTNIVINVYIHTDMVDGDHKYLSFYSFGQPYKELNQTKNIWMPTNSINIGN